MCRAHPARARPPPYGRELHSINIRPTNSHPHQSHLFTDNGMLSHMSRALVKTIVSGGGKVSGGPRGIAALEKMRIKAMKLRNIDSKDVFILLETLFEHIV